MGSTPVPNVTSRVAAAYAASTIAVSRASGSCVAQTDSKPSLSAACALDTDSSSVLTALLMTARRATTSAIYLHDFRAGAVHGPTAGRKRAVPGFIPRSCRVDSEPPALELQAIRPFVSPVPGAPAPRHRHRSARHLSGRMGEGHSRFLHRSGSR